MEKEKPYAMVLAYMTLEEFRALKISPIAATALPMENLKDLKQLTILTDSLKFGLAKNLGISLK